MEKQSEVDDQLIQDFQSSDSDIECELEDDVCFDQNIEIPWNSSYSQSESLKITESHMMPSKMGAAFFNARNNLNSLDKMSSNEGEATRECKMVGTLNSRNLRFF